MTTKNLLLFFSIVLILTACKTKLDTKQNVNSDLPLVSNAYKPSVFINDSRLKKIKDIAPAIHQLIEQHVKDRNIPGVSYGIVVDDSLIVASATGVINLDNELPSTTKSSFRIASMTKSFTAMAIMKLRDEEKLSLQDAVVQYIPEMANLTYLTSDAPIITIENLLTMTAGFPEDNPWGDRQLDETNQMLIDLMAQDVSFSNIPSFQYEYSNTGYALLGNIISHVSGIPYQEYIQKNIFQPLNMKHTYWEYDSIPEEQLVIGYRWEDEQWKKEPMLHDGSYGAMGGLITSVEDFSKYVSFHLSAWPPRSDEETEPIKRSSLREMHTPQFPRLYANSTNLDGDPCPSMLGYGYGLRITRYCEGYTEVAHGGALPGFGSNYVFFPEYGVGLMAFGNLTYTSPWPLQEIKQLLFETVELQPRKLPVSDILLERQTQIVQLIQDWDTNLEAKILAENFYLDKSKEHRMAEVKEVLGKAGSIQSMEEMTPLNQLRGGFKLLTENGVVNIFFTLTPEKDPKVQRLNMSFQPHETK